MSIKLNHTIVPAKDKEAAAKFLLSCLDSITEGRQDTLRRCRSMRN